MPLYRFENFKVAQEQQSMCLSRTESGWTLKKVSTVVSHVRLMCICARLGEGIIVRNV